jgi:diacylglycerol kinase (ATP)
LGERGGAPFEKETGLRHFFAAARYSFHGFVRLLREAAFRQQIGGLVCGLILMAVIGADALEMLIFAGLMAVLFAFEAINTAIEELVDHLSPEFSAFGKNAKDLGSFACALLIGVCAAYLTYVVIRVVLG